MTAPSGLRSCRKANLGTAPCSARFGLKAGVQMRHGIPCRGSVLPVPLPNAQDSSPWRVCRFPRSIRLHAVRPPGRMARGKPATRMPLNGGMR